MCRLMCRLAQLNLNCSTQQRSLQTSFSEAIFWHHPSTDYINILMQHCFFCDQGKKPSIRPSDEAQYIAYLSFRVPCKGVVTISFNWFQRCKEICDAMCIDSTPTATIPFPWWLLCFISLHPFAWQVVWPIFVPQLRKLWQFDLWHSSHIETHRKRVVQSSGSLRDGHIQ